MSTNDDEQDERGQVSCPSWQRYLSISIHSICDKLRRFNKIKLSFYIVITLASALLVAHLLSNNFDPTKLRHRGEPRKKRQATNSDSKTSNTPSSIDPFASRPRISTRNGHLIIESSQDKNIEFRTGGSRGAVTLNGHKLDQLLAVAKALESSSSQLAGVSLLANESMATNNVAQQYELLLKSLFGSAERLETLDKASAELKKQLAKLQEQISNSTSDQKRNLRKLRKQQDLISQKLKDNNCVDALTGLSVCKNGATCIDLYDSYKCLCPKEYEGSRCELDVDECLMLRNTDLGCQNGAKCVNLAGGYKCECPPEFHGIHCTERHDDCSLASSGSLCGHGKCVNLARTERGRVNYECICDQGWTTQPGSESPACILDVNECAAGQMLAAELGLVTSSASSSANQSQYLANANGHPYPCSQSPFVECINLPGSFQCASCPNGYSGNGRVCRDIDECRDGQNGGCSQVPLVECFNLPGSRHCGPCPAGYVGDGQQCKAMPACQATPNGGCHSMAKCTDVPGISTSGTNTPDRLCTCQFPFIGPGLGPDGCQLDIALLMGGGPMSIPGGWSTDFWPLSGVNSTSSNKNEARQSQAVAPQQDDCHPNPCLNGATCRIIDSVTFECTCPAGFAGRICEDQADYTCGGQLPSSSGLFELPPRNSVDATSGGWYESLLQRLTGSKNTSSPSYSELLAGKARRHTCTWSIKGSPANLSLKLDFFTAANQNRAIQLFLLNETHHKLPSSVLPCDQFEHMDVIEVQPDQSKQKRRLARFCAHENQQISNALVKPVQNKRLNTILVESNNAEIEYTFQVGGPRSASNEPVLSFEMNWQTIEPACGGELPLATSGSLSSPKFPEFYSAGIECRYFIRVPPDNRIRLQFGALTLLTSISEQQQCIDSLTILDGSTGPERPVLLKYCGNADFQSGDNKLSSNSWHSTATSARNDGLPEPVISSSSSVEIVLSSRPESSVPLMRPKQKRGFILTYAAEPQVPGCGGLYTARSAVVKSLDYESALISTSPEEVALAYEYSRYLNLNTNGSTSKTPEVMQWSRASMTNAKLSYIEKQAKTRCEYEIRPGDRARNHQIELNWLEMPSDTTLEASSLSRLSRRNRCARAKLSLFERQDSDNALATFCSGDRFNSSMSRLSTPIATSGHGLFLVYETMAPMAGSGAKTSNQEQDGDQLPNRKPGGFKLHYSTRCSATYKQLTGDILTELDPLNQVNECLYHLELPENYTIGLLVEPVGIVSIGSDPDDLSGQSNRVQSVTLPDGSCALQAIFMDGAKPRSRFEVSQLERQLKTFHFHSNQDQDENQEQPVVTAATATTGETPQNSWDEAVAEPEQPTRGGQTKEKLTDSSSNNNKNNNNSADTGGQNQTSAAAYWKYAASNPAHDIKEFNVCQWPGVALNSMWNHMSFLFRLSPQLLAQSNSGRESAPKADIKIQLRVRYRAERACGGVLTDQSGKFELVSSVAALASKSTSVPGNGNKRDSCSWVLRNLIPSQPIEFWFEQIPFEEIRRRKSSWIEWLRSVRNSSKQTSANSTNKTNLNDSPRLDNEYEEAIALTGSTQAQQQLTSIASNCSSAFEEIIELYEPSVNRSKLLCPADLDESSSASSVKSRHYITQSDTLFVRLINTTAALMRQMGSKSTTNSTASFWPGRAPLFSGSHDNKPLVLNYKMIEPAGNGSPKACGGKLLQSSGVIESPRHPFNYPPNTSCTWIIQSQEPQQQIRMNFTRFDLEGQLVCWFDYLEIRYGPSESSPLIGHFCNEELQSRVLISHSSSVYLHFRTDGHLNRPGFRMEFDAAQTGCGGHLTAMSGQIDSPNYPYAYLQSADCEWTIEVAQGNRIVVTIVELDLRGEPQRTDWRPAVEQVSGGEPTKQRRSRQKPCKTDSPDSEYLELLDVSRSLDSEQQWRSLSGRLCSTSGRSKSQLEFRSSDNTMSIVYKSQAQDFGRGFSLVYRSDCQIEHELDALNGVIESPGYPSAYPSSSNCSWRLRGPLGSRLTFRLIDLDVEGRANSAGLIENRNNSSALSCNEDFLQIWSIMSKNASEPIANFSLSLLNNVGKRSSELGKKIALNNQSSAELCLERKFCNRLDQLPASEQTFELNTNRALIQFRSDRSVEMRGFRLEWRARSICGGQQHGGEFVDEIVFDERTSFGASPKEPISGPIECIWSVDMSQLGRTIELELSSDMRTPMGQQQQVDDDRACQEASLTIYDGLSAARSPILIKNCQQKRSRETVFSTSGTILIKYFLKEAKQQNRLGRNFVLHGWPSSRDGCSQSVFDMQTPFLRQAIVRQSPNYPDLYEAKVYRCSSLFVSNNDGRLRFTIEELDIPNDNQTSWSETDTSTVELINAGNSLQTGDTCKQSGNFLMVKTLSHFRQTKQYYCGAKFDRSSSSLSEELRKNSVLVIESQSAWVSFNSQGKSRGKWRLSIDRLCGSLVSFHDQEREFATPDFPNRPNWPNSIQSASASENVCIWRFSTQDSWQPTKTIGTNNATDQSKRGSGDKIHFSLVQFVESGETTKETRNDCLRVYEGVELSLAQSRFNLTDLDKRFEPKMRLCSQSDLDRSTLAYTSTGSQLTVLVSGQTIAKFRVRAFDNHCGGEFQFSSAEFASPNYPQAYQSDSDCHYFLLGSPGSKLSLDFVKFDLPEGQLLDDGGKSVSCDNVDHIEIRQLSIMKRVEIKLKALAHIWLDGLQVNGLGQTLEALNLTTTSANVSKSLIESVKSINNSTSSLFQGIVRKRLASMREFLERIYELSKLSKLTGDASYETSSSAQSYFNSARIRSVFSKLSIRLEDFYANSRLIGRYCGKRVPKLPANLRDELLVRFRSYSSKTNSQQESNSRGFLAKYKIEYGGIVFVEPSDNGLMLDETDKWSSHKQGCGLLASPEYPSMSRLNQSMSWTFETKPGYVIEFDLVSLTLGSLDGTNKTITTSDCEAQDSVSIFDGITKTDLRVARLCGHLSYKRLLDKSMIDTWMRAYNGQTSPRQLPIFSSSKLLRRIRSSGPVARVVYENFQAPGSFLLQYCPVKAENQTSGHQSNINDALDEYSLERVLDAGEVETDEQYQFASAMSGGGSCSRSILLTPKWINAVKTNSSLEEVELSSPNWPQELNERQEECHWHVYTRENTNIKLAIDPISSTISPSQSQNDDTSMRNLDPLDTMTRTNNCLHRKSGRVIRNYVEVHDGSSAISPLLARYCLPAPPIELRTTGRHLFVRYVHSHFQSIAGLADNDNVNTNINDYQALSRTTSLFKSHARVTQCGGQYYVTGPLQLKDRRNSAKAYQNNLDCRYQIFAGSLNQVLVVHFSPNELDLASEPSNSDCSVGDYVELRDLPLVVRANQDPASWRAQASSAERVLARFCAGKKLDKSVRLETPASGLEIIFHTDSANVARGWQFLLTTSEPRDSCPQTSMALQLEEPFGFITSPNWPYGFNGARKCRYNLVAPLGRAIQLTFIALIRPERPTEITANPKCLDSLSYLADNEAAALRYDNGALRELKSPVSGHLLRELVEEVSCTSSMRHYGLMKLMQTSVNWGSRILPASAVNLTKSTGKTFGKLTVAEHLNLLKKAPADPITIQTQSRVMLLEYMSENLGPNEGFVAAYKLIENDYKCGGVVSPKAGQNLIESARFGQKMSQSDPYIQCEWSFKFERSSSFSDYTGSGKYSALLNSSYSWAIREYDVLDSFKTEYLVFEVLEVPPQIQNTTVFEKNFQTYGQQSANYGKNSPSDQCGLNRLLVADFFATSALIACGYFQGKTYKWALVDELAGNLQLRTRNLERVVFDDKYYDLSNGELVSSSSDELAASNVGRLKVFRGLRAHLYDSDCPSIEKSPGGSFVVVRSHRGYSTKAMNTTSQYRPGICKWSIRLLAGQYEINLLNINLRNSTRRTETLNNNDHLAASCNIDSDPSLDYIEFEYESYGEAPFLARICANNQAKLTSSSALHQLKISSGGYLRVLFVAGLDRLAIGKQEFDEKFETRERVGFELQISRVANQTSVHEFCSLRRKMNFFSFIRNRNTSQQSRLYSMDTASQINTKFLYPKNVHCQYEINLDNEEERFNFSFVNFFDLEQSTNCSADYIEISDLMEISLADMLSEYIPSWSGNTSTSKRPSSGSKRLATSVRPKAGKTTTLATTTEKSAATIQENQLFSNRKETLTPRRIGRWCGRQLPKGNFISNSSKVRIVFHSNDHIEGKGFLLEYSTFTPSSKLA